MLAGPITETSEVAPLAQIWDLWIPGAGSQGASFARARIDGAQRVLVHAAPAVVDVEVRDDGGAVIASGRGLRRTAETPMLALEVGGESVSRRDIWPSEDDIGTTVILMGGEAGTLQRWWNDDDHNEWRWSIELYNRR